MFEDYIEDAYNLALEARKASSERVAKRYYRAAIFYAVSAIEAFINFIGETLAKGEKVADYEIAFLTDRKFGIMGDKFGIMKQMDFNRLEDKLRFIIKKYVFDYDMAKEPSWTRFIEFKKFRDGLVHPRIEDDDIIVSEYDDKIKMGLSSTIEIMNRMCKGLFDKQLRKKITEMTL